MKVDFIYGTGSFSTDTVWRRENNLGYWVSNCGGTSGVFIVNKSGSIQSVSNSAGTNFVNGYRPVVCLKDSIVITANSYNENGEAISYRIEE